MMPLFSCTHRAPPILLCARLGARAFNYRAHTLYEREHVAVGAALDYSLRGFTVQPCSQLCPMAAEKLTARNSPSHERVR